MISNPLLKLDPLWSIAIISFVISLLITLIYKLMTDQGLMKNLKEEMKKHQREVKEQRGNPKKMMEVQRKSMEKNWQYMKHSFRPTIITIIPIFVVLGWMNAHLAYEPISPDEEFKTTAVFEGGVSKTVTLVVPEGIEIIGNASQEIKDRTAEWSLRGEKGEYLLDYRLDSESFTREVLITEERSYKKPIVYVKDDEIKILKIDNKPTKPLWKLNWVWTYFLFAVIFSMLFRKILKIY